MTNKRHNVLYVGVAGNLEGRTIQYKETATPGFTSHYNVNKLVYYEEFSEINNAILRENQIKGGSRQNKIELINSLNPYWENLLETLNTDNRR